MSALFFDIDGTLLDWNHKLPESTRNAVLQAKENGHLIFINSGRTKAYIYDKNLLSLGFDGIICGCGTHIIFHGKELLYHKLSKKLTKKTVEVCYDSNIPIIMEGREWLFMDRDMICRDQYGKRLFENESSIIQPIANNEENWECSKFCAAVDGISYEKAVDELSSDYTIKEHEGKALEFVPRGYSKRTGIRKICEYTGIDPKDTYAFGDGTNDVEMLEGAGVGVAMGNAKEPAVEAADYVTDDIHQDGIQNALLHFHLI